LAQLRYRSSHRGMSQESTIRIIKPPEGHEPQGLGAMTQRLLTAVEVADLLAVPKTRVWSMSRRGKIPTVRIGAREVRYRAEDIDQWTARRTTSRPRGIQS
jgi:excisionase family DNA binding protein